MSKLINVLVVVALTMVIIHVGMMIYEMVRMKKCDTIVERIEGKVDTYIDELRNHNPPVEQLQGEQI